MMRYMMRDGFYAAHSAGSQFGWVRAICMLIGGAILIGAVVLLIVVLTRKHASPPSGTDQTAVLNNTNAMNILNERYARGEVNDEEYAIKKAELKK